MTWLQLPRLPLIVLPPIVMGVTGLEFAAVALLGRRFGWAMSPLESVLMLLPGAALTGALWLALAGYGVGAIGAALLLAGGAHAADLWWRLQRKPSAD